MQHANRIIKNGNAGSGMTSPGVVFCGESFRGEAVLAWQ
jgi:hypothetical protein